MTRARLEQEAAKLRKMVELHPDSLEYLDRYANALIELGETLPAQLALRKLAQMLRGAGKNREAAAFDDRRRELARRPREPMIDALHQSAAHAKLWHRPKTVELEEAQYLYRQGEASSEVYLLESGEITLWRRFGEHRNPVLIATLSPPAIVGDIAFFRGTRRAEDALARTSCRLLCFSPRTITRILLDHPEIEGEWQRLAETDYRLLLLSMNEMLAGIPESLRRFLAERSSSVELPPFGIAAREGTPIEEVCLLVDGRLRRMVEDQQGNSHIFSSIGPGEIFGWEAAMHGHTGFSSDAWLTSLIAIEPCRLIRIPMRDFREVLDCHPPLRAAIARHVHHYVSDTLARLRAVTPPED